MNQVSTHYIHRSYKDINKFLEYPEEPEDHCFERVFLFFADPRAVLTSPAQQDSLGKSITFKRRYTNDHDVWAGPLSDGSTVAGEFTHMC